MIDRKSNNIKIPNKLTKRKRKEKKEGNHNQLGNLEAPMSYY